MIKRIILPPLAFLLFFPLSISFAQETPSLVPEQESTQLTTVATVNVTDATFVQNGHDFDISFDISNRVGIQARVKYGVTLIKNTSAGQVIVDEHVYDEVMTFGERDVVHKTVAYSAPAVLYGSFTLMLSSENESGLLLSILPLGDIVLEQGSAQQGLWLNTETCYLTIQNESGAPRYSPVQGVDIESTEVLSSNCVVENNSAQSITVAPMFVTQRRSLFGEEVSTEGGDSRPITLAAGEKRVLVTALPLAQVPQAYTVALSYGGESNHITYHYVIRGGSGTIQNVFFDRDSYEQGEEAHISFMWSGAADNFADSRYSAGTPLSSPSLLLELTDGSGRACADPLQVSLHQSGPVKDVKMAVTHYCAAPKVRAVLTDGAFGTLGAMTFEAPASPDALTSKSDTDETSGEDSQKTSWLSIGFWVAIFILIVAGAYVAFRFAKKSMPPIALFIILFGFASFLFQPLEASADTFVAYYRWDARTYTVFRVGIDKLNYAPGERVVMYGTSDGLIGPVQEEDPLYRWIRLVLTKFGSTQWDYNSENVPYFFGYTSNHSNMVGAITMSAPASPGSHDVVMSGNLAGSPAAFITLPFNVVSISVGF